MVGYMMHRRRSIAQDEMRYDTSGPFARWMTLAVVTAGNTALSIWFKHWCRAGAPVDEGGIEGSGNWEDLQQSPGYLRAPTRCPGLENLTERAPWA